MGATTEKITSKSVKIHSIQNFNYFSFTQDQPFHFMG